MVSDDMASLNKPINVTSTIYVRICAVYITESVSWRPECHFSTRHLGSPLERPLHAQIARCCGNMIYTSRAWMSEILAWDSFAPCYASTLLHVSQLLSLYSIQWMGPVLNLFKVMSVSFILNHSKKPNRKFPLNYVDSFFINVAYSYWSTNADDSTKALRRLIF
jgi:hypothetical protein